MTGLGNDYGNGKAPERSRASGTSHARPGGKDAALYVRHGCLTLRVAADILVCRGAGLPSPAERTDAGGKAPERSPASEPFTPVRAAGMPPSTSGMDA